MKGKPQAFQVDERLQEIMKNIYKNCSDATDEFYNATNLIQGANIAGFISKCTQIQRVKKMDFVSQILDNEATCRKVQ